MVTAQALLVFSLALLSLVVYEFLSVVLTKVSLPYERLLVTELVYKFSVEVPCMGH